MGRVAGTSADGSIDFVARTLADGFFDLFVSLITCRPIAFESPGVWKLATCCRQQRRVAVVQSHLLGGVFDVCDISNSVLSSTCLRYITDYGDGGSVFLNESLWTSRSASARSAGHDFRHSTFGRAWSRYPSAIPHAISARVKVFP